MTGTRRWLPQGLLVIWTGLSTAAALQPPGVGGTLRALGAAAFMILGPALAGVLITWRTRSQRRGELPVPALVEMVAWLAAWVAVLVMTSTALLVAGVWSVRVMVLFVAAATLALTLWPMPDRRGRRRSV